MQYRLVKHVDIDKPKWDQYLDTCFNARIEGYSWYLDAVSPNWTACIIGDYKAVLPITIDKKWGVFPRWLNPPFCQQLGVFSVENNENYFDVVKDIAKNFSKTHIHLNAGFAYEQPIENRTNFYLNLDKDYETLRANYNKDARKNLKNPLDFTVKLEEVNKETIDNTIAIYLTQYGDKQKLNSFLRMRLSDLLLAAQRHNAVTNYVINGSDNQLYFSAFVLKDANRLYYLFAAPTNDGRDVNIAHYFIDFLIKEHANSGLILDFEGSSIPSVAQFYKKWGGNVEEYGVFKG